MHERDALAALDGDSILEVRDLVKTDTTLNHLYYCVNPNPTYPIN